jgi:hypothetical protein
MSQKAQENLIAGTLFIVFGAYLILCLGFGPNARLVPLPMAILGLLLVAYQLVQQNWLHSEAAAAGDNLVTPGGNENGDGDSNSNGNENQTIKQDGNRDSRRELQAFACVAGFVLLAAVLGPLLAVFLFSSGYLIVSRYMPPGKALLTACIFTTVLYGLFVIGLRLQLYHGVLAPLLERF